MDRNREALESGGKYLHGVIGQGDLENPDENWVLVGYWAVCFSGQHRPVDVKKKKLSTAFTAVVEYVHICLD